VVELIEKKPEDVELVLTGRGALEDIIRRADIVTEMMVVKHPYEKGMPARKGIEY
jgi:cob(I)alamin adenosyltransferase